MKTTKFLINPSYQRLEKALKNVPLWMDSDEGVVIQTGRNLIKKIEIEPGFWINVKRYHKPAWLNKIIYSSGIRKPKGKRAYIYPEKLAQIGIYSPESIAYIEERNWGFLGYTYFVSLQIDYEHKCYEFSELQVDSNMELIRSFATFAARLHEGGMMHRDFSPGNILWTYRNNQYLFALVDTNRMRFGRVNMRLGCKNFSRLYGHKPFFKALATAYAEQRGFDIEECIRLTLKYRRRFWERYARHKPDMISFELDL